MPPSILVSFTGGPSGAWHVASHDAHVGATLAAAERLDVQEGRMTAPEGVWTLRGTTSHARYTIRSETDALVARQEGLHRPDATCAAMIAIRKSPAWWDLAQDERRAIFQERSRHIAIGLDYLPAIARRLHHSRDLGEPFDFITWFEYAPQDARAFDHMVERLRASEEWRFVEREVDVRVVRRTSRG